MTDFRFDLKDQSICARKIPAILRKNKADYVK